MLNGSFMIYMKSIKINFWNKLEFPEPKYLFHRIKLSFEGWGPIHRCNEILDI